MQLKDKQSLTLKSETDLLSTDKAASLVSGVASGKIKINERIFIIYTEGGESFYYVYSPIFNKLISTDEQSLNIYKFSFEYSLDECIVQLLSLCNLTQLGDL